MDSLLTGGLLVNRTTGRGEHPAELIVQEHNKAPRLLRVYVWNVTHGGGAARAANEYRIQVTGIDRFEAPPGGEVLILGWFEELEVFAAFDFRFHSVRLGASPSIQIGRNALEAAARNGFAPYTRGNGEITVAVRWDLLAAYVSQLKELHDFGDGVEDFRALEHISDNPENLAPALSPSISAPRSRVLVQTARLLRDAGFRDRVLAAYGHACAFCGVQLELLDAAHIVPVNHDASSDEVSNGIALCALHHRSYDRSLITFDTSYRLVIDERRMDRLRMRERALGEDGFRRALRETIVLPSRTDHRPKPEIVSLANELRGWRLA
ncbi:HNH endonuclease [Luteibacter sp. 3190]|uniref:HNH endonuclease n=1 Tax=Luteibacter sp. 3190 TaxID=2817736 RepID=UPI0028602BFD|nr:HNH endonuclease [Luteibacter sp. 3190]MDR6938197.1 putative restriction endonuclease [Luteibacter sp. 3190]